MVNSKEKMQYSLQVMTQMRKDLIKNILNNDPDLYDGLHTSSSSPTFNLYLEKYRIAWIDLHWICINEDLEEQYGNHVMYAKDKKEILKYFVDFFSVFISSIGIENKAITEEYINLLRIKKNALTDMLNANEKWDKNLARLRVDLKKHKEFYEDLINKYKDKVNENDKSVRND